MNTQPLISVIVPIYNTEKYLNACVDSILKQTYKNIEIILVDDESPDNCPAICDNLADKYDNITVVHKKNEGLGLTRNAGLIVAHGDYVCFLDSDDTLDEDTFSGCVEALYDRCADACFYGRKTGNKDGSFSVNSNIPQKLEYNKDEVKQGFAPRYLGQLPDDDGAEYIQASACCAMYRRSVIVNNNIQFLSEREYLSEDTLFNLEFCKYAEKVIIIPKDYYNYTYNGESLTKKYNPNRFYQLKNFFKILLQKKEDYSYVSDCDRRVSFLFYVYLRHTIEYEVKSRKINGTVNSFRRINEICKDDFIIDFIANMDMESLSKKRKLFIYLVLHKHAIVIFLIYLFKSIF